MLRHFSLVLKSLPCPLPTRQFKVDRLLGARGEIFFLRCERQLMVPNKQFPLLHLFFL